MGHAAGLDKMDIRWMLEEAACDCHRMDVEPMDPRFDPAFVINEARKVPPTSVVISTFMDAYCASLQSAIISGVDVCSLSPQSCSVMLDLVVCGVFL